MIKHHYGNCLIFFLQVLLLFSSSLPSFQGIYCPHHQRFLCFKSRLFLCVLCSCYTLNWSNKLQVRMCNISIHLPPFDRHRRNHHHLVVSSGPGPACHRTTLWIQNVYRNSFFIIENFITYFIITIELRKMIEKRYKILCFINMVRGSTFRIFFTVLLGCSPHYLSSWWTFIAGLVLHLPRLSPVSHSTVQFDIHR